MKTKTILGSGALATLAAVALFGSAASAAVPNQGRSQAGQVSQPHPVRVAGRIASISTTGLVLAARQNRTINVSVSSNTWILAPNANGRCVEGTLSILHVDSPAQVLGMSTTVTNTVDARAIAQGVCMREFNGRMAARARAIARLTEHVAAGTVKSVNGANLTITNENGRDISVTTTGDTVVFANGFASIGSVKVGDKVQVFGKREAPANIGATPSTPTVTAWAIHDRGAGTNMVLGHVQTVSGNTITLRTLRAPRGRAVTLDGNTAYKALQLADGKFTLVPATRADVKPGSNLVVEANVSQDGRTATAKAVVILPVGQVGTPTP